jgi:hypothetical protein
VLRAGLGLYVRACDRAAGTCSVNGFQIDAQLVSKRARCRAGLSGEMLGWLWRCWGTRRPLARWSGKRADDSAGIGTPGTFLNELHYRCADLDDVAGLAEAPRDMSGARRRNLDDRLGGFDGKERLIGDDVVTTLTCQATSSASRRPSPRSGKVNVLMRRPSFV